MVYQISKFPNGFTVATAFMPQMRSVSVGIWVGVGSRFETPEVNGVCHFIEHVVFKGTAKRSAREISEAVEGLGGYLNAFTSEETTCFHARVSHEHFDSVLDVLMDMLLFPRLERTDIDKEREVIKEEIAMYLDEPQHQVQEVLNQILWQGHPLGRPITGTPETLDSIGRSKIASYLQQNYVGANSVLVVAGKLKHSQVVKAAEPYIRRFRVGARPAFTAATEAQAEPVLKLVSRDTEQTQIAFGIRTCSRYAPRRYALRLLNTVLGENMSSRLFQVIREDRGLAYSIYSTPSFFADTGDLVISAGLDEGNIQRVMRLILAELHRLREKLVPEAEMCRARDYVIGQMELSLEATEAQMNWAGEQILGYGRVLRQETVQEKLASVTRSDVRETACAFFRPERFNLALVTARKKLPEVRKLLDSAF